MVSMTKAIAYLFSKRTNFLFNTNFLKKEFHHLVKFQPHAIV